MMSNYKKNCYGRGLHYDLEDLQIQVQQQQQKQEQLQAQLQLQQQKQEQLQLQAQAQAQTDTDTSTFENIGNPVVHVNVNEGCDSKKHDKKEKSAFRAVKNTPTQIPFANTNVKVTFTDEQFDLNNEYDSNTSTFVAKTAGVYLFTATTSFSPTNVNLDYEFGMVLRVNAAQLDVEADYTGFNAVYYNYVELNEIVWLNAGDTVDILAFSTIPGTVVADTRIGFAGAKIS